MLFSRQQWVCLLAALSALAVANADDDLVTCGSAVKLSHYESKSQTKSEYFLSSEEKQLGGGSGQQIVTAISPTASTNALWYIREPNAGSETRGAEAACVKEGVAEPIACGSIIRLTHLNTLKNLHSHNVRSPLSRQQEVSAFGEGDMNGDDGDDWRVECTTKYWKRESMVSFRHVDSGKYLGASSTVKFTHQNCGHNCPILNHLEVFGRSQKDSYVSWVVEMGVHLYH